MSEKFGTIAHGYFGSNRVKCARGDGRPGRLQEHARRAEMIFDHIAEDTVRGAAGPSGGTLSRRTFLMAGAGPAGGGLVGGGFCRAGPDPPPGAAGGGVGRLLSARLRALSPRGPVPGAL